MKPFIAQLIPSPFKGVNDVDNITSLEVIPIVIGNIIQALLVIGGAIAVIMIAWAGINYVVSQGDPGRTKSAKDTLTYAIIGLIISSGAYLIVGFVLSRFG